MITFWFSCSQSCMYVELLILVWLTPLVVTGLCRTVEYSRHGSDVWDLLNMHERLLNNSNTCQAKSAVNKTETTLAVNSHCERVEYSWDAVLVDWAWFNVSTNTVYGYTGDGMRCCVTRIIIASCKGCWSYMYVYSSVCVCGRYLC